MNGWRWAGVALVAAALRLPSLDIRPMHGDEAVMAVKAGALAWGGEGSAYDPTGYHGTLLGWMARPVLLLAGAKSLADTDERHFRLVTAICGILLCLTPLLLADGLGANGALIAGLLLAVSPAFVYWSRFYIQEVPLVLATALCLGCGWRFARSGRPGWLWGASVSAGLMLCLKETAWLSFFAGGVALAVVKPARNWIGRHWTRLLWPGAVALIMPALVLGPSALLAPLHYWRLGLTGGDHAHPWHWYALNFQSPDTLIMLLASFAGIIPFAGSRRVTAVYADFITATWLYWISLLVFYSVLPYKTPWCFLNMLFPGTILGSILISWLAPAVQRFSLMRPWWATPRWMDPVWLVLIIGGIAFAGWKFSFSLSADRRNPFVYAQPVEDVRRLGRLAGKISAVHPKGREMIVAVQAENPWPLPWELRAFPNVGYWAPGDPDAKRGFRMAVVRIAPAGPGSQGLMFGIRPGEIVAVEADPALLRRALPRD